MRARGVESVGKGETCGAVGGSKKQEHVTRFETSKRNCTTYAVCSAYVIANIPATVRLTISKKHMLYQSLEINACIVVSTLGRTIFVLV